MPPNTSALTNPHASASIPSSRPDDHARAQAWRIASHGQPLPIQHSSIQTTQPEAPARTPDLVTDGPVDLDAAATKPGDRANQGQSPLPQGPVTEHAPVAEPLAEGDELIDSSAAVGLAPPASPSPEAAGSAGEPISGSPPSPAMPAMNAAEGKARLRTQTDPIGTSAHQNASTSARTGHTHPRPYASAPREMPTADLPALAPRQHRGAPRTQGEPPRTTLSPVAVAPDRLDLPRAKPTAKEITFITQAAIETPQPSDVPTISEPVAIPVPAQAKTTSTPAHPLATAHHPGTRVTPVIRPSTRESASHALLITPPLVESTNPSTSAPSSPSPADIALPSTSAPPSPSPADIALTGEATRPGIDAADVRPLAKPAAPSPVPVLVEDGPVEFGRPVVSEPVRNEPTVTSSAQAIPHSGVSASKIHVAKQPELVEPVQLSPTSMPDPVPAAQTSLTDTPPAAPSHDTLPSARPDTSDALPAQAPLVSLAPSPAPAPVAEHAHIPAPPRGPAMPERPVAPKPNRGEQVTPLAPQPQAAPTTLSAETKASPEPAPSLPVVESVPSSGTAASDVPLPQPKADHAPRLPGHPNPRSPHPGSRLAQPESAAQPVEPNLPSSAPQVEAQTTPTAKAEEGAADEATVWPAPAPTSRPSTDSQPLSPPTPSAMPPLAVAVPTSSEKPMPRPDASAPAAPVAPVTASQNAPSVPVSPVLATPVQVQDAQTQRRPRNAEDDARFSQTESTPAPAAQSHQTRPLTAQAPRAGVSDDQRNSTGNRNPSGHTPAQAAPALPAGNDRPVDLPAPQTLASPGPSDPSVTAPAQVSPPVVHAPPVDVRPPHLPNPMVPLAAQAARDDGLAMTVMPHSARMSIESSDGDLALHLRVRDGSADVTVGGSMAPLFEARAPEARAALASEGLNLGRFDLGQQGGGSGGQQGQPAPERHERAAEPATPYRQQSSHHEPAPGDGRIHVTA